MPQVAHPAATPAQAGRPGQLTPTVVRAISLAQQKTNADPGLLLALASKESAFNPKARNKHSSARGLLQFTNTTWLTVVKDFGSRYGLGHYATAIETGRDGHLLVKKPRLRQAILALRNDPLLQAIMTTELLNQERHSLEDRLGRPAQVADLYFLHLLGPTGATHFLTALAERPDASSVETVGKEARFNEGLFVKDGRPLTVAEAYAGVQAALDVQASGDPAQVQTKVIPVADAR